MKAGHHAFSLSRVAAITGATLKGLTRLKTFYGLLLFALLLIGNSIFMAQMTFQQEFQVLKDIALGAMSIFTSLLAVAATARQRLRWTPFGGCDPAACSRFGVMRILGPPRDPSPTRGAMSSDGPLTPEGRRRGRQAQAHAGVLGAHPE